MSYLVVLVVDNVEKCPAMLDAWEEAGVLGVTVLNSTGIGHIRKAGLRDDLPMFPSLQDLFSNEEILNKTLFSVVESRELVDRMIEKVNLVIGNLDDPHTGFMFVQPIEEVYGMGRTRKDRSKE
jgi:nitrogen regulatory protein PII